MVNGCIRDSAAIASLPIGILALNTHPLKSGKQGLGRENLPIVLAGVTFRPGERVRIVDGPFNDFRGTVSELDLEKNKVRVMVNFFGRETPVELDFLQVEKS